MIQGRSNQKLLCGLRSRKPSIFFRFFRSLEKCRPFLGHYLPKLEGKWQKLPMILRIFVRVLFGLQVGRPWLEQWEKFLKISWEKSLNFPIGSRITGKSFLAAGCQPWSNLLNFSLNSGISRNSSISSKKKHKKLFTLKSTHRALALESSAALATRRRKKPLSDHQRNLIRENSFIYCRAVDRTSRFSFLFW